MGVLYIQYEGIEKFPPGTHFGLGGLNHFAF